MINDVWMCQKHQQEISFICVGNVWHFEPLCNSCIPQHTKNHPKNIKVQLEAVKQIIPKATDLKKKVSTIFEERLKRCSILEEIKQEQWAYITSINHKRQATIKQINEFFDDLISQIRKRRAEQQHTQKLNIAKIHQQIMDKIIFFKKEDYVDLGNFCNEIKKYYFKDNMEIYVEEMDQILQDYEEKIIKHDPFVWAKDLPTKMKKLLAESYKLEDTNDKKNPKEKIEVKKQTKRKQLVKKRCPTCKQEMEYLTQWKKHLVCRNCGNKQRNYVKKV